MGDEQPRGQSAPECRPGDHDAEKSGCHHSVFHRALPSVIPYKLLIPEAMASQSSCNFGRNRVMAMMAITTSTQVSQ